MSRLWAKLDRRFGLALFAVAAATLGGCGVDKKEYDALKTENDELRTKVTTADTTAAANEAKINELASKVSAMESQKVAQPINDPQGRQQRGSGGGDTVLEIAGDVLFDPGQAVVKSSAKKQLDKIASQLNGQYAGHNVRVEGYTDTDKPKKGKFKSNQALSEARADAVRAYIVSKGVSSGRVNSVGYGDSKPKSSKAASRRVDIVILGN